MGTCCEKTTRLHFDVQDMLSFAKLVLQKAGYSKKAADAAAYALLDADLKGIFSHGIAGGTGLEEAVLRSGVTSTVDVNAVPEIVTQKYSAVSVIDAKGCPGHLSSLMAVEIAKKKAKKYGLCKVYVINANHFGAAGTWSDLIAKDKTLEGIVTCTTAACAPVMGDDPEGLDYTKGMGNKVRMGTDPIAISIPYADGMVTLDMALTRLAASYCVKSFKSGEKIKIPNYVCDKNGRETLDPKEVFLMSDKQMKFVGGFYPLGSQAAGYKGSALGVVNVEMDHLFAGGPVEIVPWNGAGEKRRVSHCFQAQAIDFHYTQDEAKKRASIFMKDYETYFGPFSRWPGDRSKKAMEYCYDSGIPYSKGQVDTLKRVATLVGLDFDCLVKSNGQKDYPIDIFKK